MLRLKMDWVRDCVRYGRPTELLRRWIVVVILFLTSHNPHLLAALEYGGKGCSRSVGENWPRERAIYEVMARVVVLAFGFCFDRVLVAYEWTCILALPQIARFYRLAPGGLGPIYCQGMARTTRRDCLPLRLLCVACSHLFDHFFIYNFCMMN